MTDFDLLPAVLTVEEVARFLRISRGAAYEGVRRGEIPSVNFGRTIRIPRHALLVLLGAEDPREATRPADAAHPAARSAGPRGDLNEVAR